MARALALREVMEYAVEVEREMAKPTPLKRIPRKLIIAACVCLPIIGFSVYSWVARPEFIWGPRPEAVPEVEREAAVRFELFLIAQRVQAYRAASGRYPISLATIGITSDSLALSVISDSVFALRATSGGESIVYRSDESVDGFLGSSADVITTRKGK